MTYRHRQWHWWAWGVLAPLVAAGLVAAIRVRP